MRYLLLFLIIVPIVSAGVSDLYDFSVSKIGANITLSGTDTNNNKRNDSIYAKVVLDRTINGEISFDLEQNGTFLNHSEANITKNFAGAIGKFGNGTYKVTITVSTTEPLLRKELTFTATNFDLLNQPITPSPTTKNATYSFLDPDSDGLYDYLAISPSGNAQVFDAFGEFLASGNNIDLRGFSQEKIDGPFRIVVESSGEIFTVLTEPITNNQFEKPLLPDLSVTNTPEGLVIACAGAAAFDFSYVLLENEEIVEEKQVLYLLPGETIATNYAPTKQTKLYLDWRNAVEESDEENNIYSSTEPSPATSFSINATSKSNAFLGKLFDVVRSEPKIMEEPVGGEEEQFDQSPATQDSLSRTNAKTNANSLTGLSISEPTGEPNKTFGFALMLATAALGLYLYRILFKD